MGDVVAYEYVIENIGSTPLTSVALTDTYDSRLLEFIEAWPNPTSAMEYPHYGVIEWADLTGPLPVGFNRPLQAGESFTVTASFLARSPGNAEDFATVTALGPQGEEVSGEDSDEVKIQQGGTDLQITKTLVQPPVGPALVGSNVRFDIRLENVGDQTITTLPMRACTTQPTSPTWVPTTRPTTRPTMGCWIGAT